MVHLKALVNSSNIILIRTNRRLPHQHSSPYRRSNHTRKTDIIYKMCCASRFIKLYD